MYKQQASEIKYKVQKKTQVNKEMKHKVKVTFQVN